MLDYRPSAAGLGRRGGATNQNAGEQSMAELNKNARDEAGVVGEDYTWAEVAYWLIGIVMIPLVPILMIAFLNPFSGVGPHGH
jgi:hypothetical protein